MNPRSGYAWLTVSLFLALVPAVAHGAWPHDPLVNVQIAPAGFNQYIGSIVSDGAGGAIMVWTDERAGNADIYAQRITATGAVAGGWPIGGLVICGAPESQYEPAMVSDGAGGAIIAWTDWRGAPASRDIYAQRVTGAGTIPGGWPVNGRKLTTLNPDKEEFAPVIVSDGAGGAIVVWELNFTPATDIDVYGARVNSSGTVLWSTGLATPGGIQQNHAVVSDGAAGALVAYEDNASGNYDIRALRVGPVGVVVGPVAVCTQLGAQDEACAVTDGSGGFYIAWQDSRVPGIDLWAAHVNSALTPVWAADGVRVSTGTGAELSQVIASDGNHGAILAWLDGDAATIYASHLQPGGIDAGWLPGGNAISTPGNKVPASIAPDGTGGAIVAITNIGSGYDIYATRVTSAGATPWGYGDVPVSTALSTQTNTVLTADGNGGAILAWYDQRAFAFSNIYAQNIDHFGKLGDATPAFTSLNDVRGDQGGRVRLAWNASYLDADPAYEIGQYWIWRQTPVTGALKAGRWLDNALERELETASADQQAALARGGLYTRTQVGSASYTWEFLAAQPASGFPTYSYVASTTRDSLGSSNPYTVFMVQARRASGTGFWNSAPDSIYSVDNLPPLPPAPFTGAYLSGATHLHWGANHELDLAGYRLYRGSSPGFIPGPGNLVVAQPDTGYNDAGPAGRYYKLSAVDAHGNESAFALLGPGETGDVGDGLPGEIAFSLASENPARSSIAFRIALPARGHVSLAMYDAAGRRVRQLLDTDLEPGVRTELWDGRDRNGRASPNGLYLAFLRAGGREIVRRVLISR